MITKPVLTSAELAELLGHPEPDSRAARAKVQRLIEQGLPFVRGMRPRLFLLAQVLAWLEAQTRAETRNEPTQTETEDVRAQIQARIDALKGEACV